MTPAPRWTTQQLTIDAAAARNLFRIQRLDEPLAKWKEAFDRYKDSFGRLFDRHGAVDPASITPRQLADIFRAGLGDELRYLAGPPISADDLKELADVPSLAPGSLVKDPDGSKRIIDTILQALDAERLPWVAERGQPTEAQKAAAILASAALLTKQRVQTDRANQGKDTQEAAVKDYLRDTGFKEVAARAMSNLTTAPNPGEFCGEALVGSRKADIAVRLWDGRLLPIECKVSNSSTNSVKRLNNDAAVKARIWLHELGANQIVPAAVLSGVFKVLNLEQAQAGQLTLFWAHQLDALERFIEATRNSPRTK